MSSLRDTPAELASCIVAATQRQRNGADGTSGRIAEKVCRMVGDDLFDDGEEKIVRTLYELLEGPLPPAERAECEVALGVLREYGLTTAFPDQVVQAAGMARARDAGEHVAALVVARCGMEEACQVRRRLTEALLLCDFTKPAGATARRKKKSVEQLLDADLPLNE